MRIVSQTVMRDYEVVGLAKHEDRFTVMILRKGETEPRDTDSTVTEFVDVSELHDEGIFGYYTEKERKIFFRGVTKDGFDKNPATGGKRRPKIEPVAADEVGHECPTGEQTCRLCNQRKPLSDFSRYAKSKTGFRNYCKDCAREAAKRYLDAKLAGSKKEGSKS